MSDENKLSRRDFIKEAAVGAAAVAGAGALAAVGSTPAQAQTPAPWLPAKWDYEADVVVVGFGGSGAVAAVQAQAAGAKVLILEKAAEGLEGGNTGCSMGSVGCPTDLPLAIRFYQGVGMGTTDDAEMKAYAEGLYKIPDWLPKLGGEWNTPTPGPANMIVPATKEQYQSVSLSMKPSGTEPKGGYLLFRLLKGLLKAKGVQVLFETPGTDLVQNAATKEILGVVAQAKGQKIYVKAKRAVVLSSGGYEGNPEMLGHYNFPGIHIRPTGTPYNTGDGQLMALAAGAVPSHYANFDWSSSQSIKKASDPIGTGVPLNLLGNNYIYVNKDGKRFMNELLNLTHTKEQLALTAFNGTRAEFYNQPYYLVFDQTLMKAGPLATLDTPSAGTHYWYSKVHKLYTWSSDNSAELQKGWIVKGNTLQELATNLKVDPAGLADTVGKYNKLCDQKKDADFGRTDTTLAPIATPPFYALELETAMIATSGGPKRTMKGAVLDRNNKPIPRLYAAGEVGSPFAWIGFQGLPMAFSTGYAAGNSAAAEKAWE